MKNTAKVKFILYILDLAKHNGFISVEVNTDYL